MEYARARAQEDCMYVPRRAVDRGLCTRKTARSQSGFQSARNPGRRTASRDREREPRPRPRARTDTLQTQIEFPVAGATRGASRSDGRHLGTAQGRSQTSPRRRWEAARGRTRTRSRRLTAGSRIPDSWILACCVLHVDSRMTPAALNSLLCAYPRVPKAASAARPIGGVAGGRRREVSRLPCPACLLRVCASRGAVIRTLIRKANMYTQRL
ncbi:hypothetical protein BD413DRAFT_22162 [Trametes elegans]|nr:hypothetical protein BD413DRAFT_22162 [Trametes elegans]